MNIDGSRLAIHGGSPVRGSFLAFGRPSIGAAEGSEVLDTLQSGWVGPGPKVALFENQFASYVGSRFAVALNSCSAALYLGLRTLGVGPGDEVITTPLTFAATANSILNCGARVVFADIDPLTHTIDPRLVERAITPRTKALLPVHFAGYPCDMDALMDIARKHDLYIIEDAAHAVEAFYRGRKIGSIGDVTCFSFQAGKNITTGEGGMVTLNNPEWADRIRILSQHGLNRDSWARVSGRGQLGYEVIEPGFKFRMSDIQAALGIPQLRQIEEKYTVRRRVWDQYGRAFSDLPLLTPNVDIPAGSRHGLHIYPVLLQLECMREDRAFFLAALHGENIGAGIHYPALHLQKYYRERFGYEYNSLPNSEFVSFRTVSLPCGSGLTEEDVADVIAAVRKILLYLSK